MTERLLEPIGFPSASDEWIAFTQERPRRRLTRIDDLVATLCDGSDRSALESLTIWNDLQIDLTAVRNEAELLSEVHPDRDVREAMEAVLTQAQAKASSMMADSRLADLFASTGESGLDPAALRVHTHLLRDFRRGGAYLDQEARHRVAELAARDSELSVRFSRNIREGGRRIRVDPAALVGLPDDFVKAHPVGDDGRVALSTDATDFMPVQRYANDRELRIRLAKERADLAWPDNDAILEELLEVRRQRAEILGYGTWADYEADGRMAGSADRVSSFLDEIDAASGPAAEREYRVLLDRLREEELDADVVTVADQPYLLRALHAERFDVDAQKVRSYFDYEKVLRGVLEITAMLCDVDFVASDVPAWHEDVRSFDVKRGGSRLGRIHLDMHPRGGKFNHAACFRIAPGIRGRILAEAALVCNFPTGLMEHRQVQTFFHEFGHLMHEILAGQHDWVEFAGIATEWDFSEAPSQMLEEWVWDADVLRTFATDASGEPIPHDLVERMNRADRFGRALLVRTQLGHARVSLHLHVDDRRDLAAATAHWYEVSTPVARLNGSHSYAAFGHLTSYGACYYTYQWSLVIARDLLSGFVDGLLDREAAARYRREILEPGGSRDAADLVAAFLGRGFSVDAYRAWLDG